MHKNRRWVQKWRQTETAEEWHWRVTNTGREQEESWSSCSEEILQLTCVVDFLTLLNISGSQLHLLMNTFGQILSKSLFSNEIGNIGNAEGEIKIILLARNRFSCQLGFLSYSLSMGRKGRWSLLMTPSISISTTLLYLCTFLQLHVTWAQQPGQIDQLPSFYS